jgi:hypothetical protein
MRDEKYITKIIAASLLGDGSVGYNKTKYPSFEIRILTEHKDHLDYLASVIEPLTKCSWYERPAHDFVQNGKTYHRKTQTRLRTSAHPFFKPFRDRMYPLGHKIVDPHYLKLLDWEFLAVWYMQDGHLSAYTNKKNNKLHYFQLGLATNSFSYADNHFLRIQLKERLDLDFSVNIHTNTSGTRGYKLKLNSQQIDYFCENVKPYIQPSFEYKINKDTTLERIEVLQEAKRNTVI